MIASDLQNSKSPHQYSFDLAGRPAMGRDDFLVAPCNEVALSWIDFWPNWPGPALILQGPSACGKSHMAAVWKDRTKAVEISASDLGEQSAEDLIPSCAPLLIENLDPWLGNRASEVTLFHLYNMIREAGQSLFLTMKMPPQSHLFTVPDLASRLNAAPVARIKPPDDILLAAILVKLFRDRQLQIDQNIIHYIMPRIERSFSAVRDLVKRADQLALSRQKSVSIPIVREVLQNQNEEN